MIHASKMLWGEGLFLRPQHFQRQDAYHEWRLAEMSRALHPYAWGVRSLRVATEALQAGVLRITELQAIFPDGEVYDAPHVDELPPPLPLSALQELGAQTVFHLAMAPLRTHGSNFAATQEEASTAVRYVQHHEPASDWYTGAVEAEITTLRKSVKLLADPQPRDHLVSIPLLRLKRTSTGEMEIDPRFVPPSLSISASPVLHGSLRRLLDVLQAKVDALYGFHREPSRNVIEFRSGDVASFWLLHTASAAFAALSHCFHHPRLHPERLFERLLELAGALMTFSRTYTLADLPVYQHDNPGPAFAKLDHIVRELLETVISTRYFAISLEEVRPSFHHGRLDSEKINAQTHLYLGIAADLPPTELVEALPMRLKVGSPDDVEKMVLSALPGVRLTHAPQVPAAVPVRPGHFYFLLEPRGPLYERMLQSQSISIYVPAGISGLELELVAVAQ
ncbi:MAG TPA: type VI secretion system baseplate subunit TssK [Burkholderiaceae bacterium]|nr:type VI secretion system baseplate subunit TssK [Burkholderiaceae bacterium]